MTRNRAALLLTLAFVISCGDSSVDGDGGSESETDTGGECDLGTEGCACDQGSCVTGLNCIDDVCVNASCGDGIVDPGEVCDDGNQDNTDSCVDGCVEASCGDGFVGPGEVCDDGNDIDDDACSNACVPATCGDGIVQEPEQCDDANEIETDDCLSTCAQASCGDGFVHAGVEVCDDGNDAETDACLTTCVEASCGDGFVHEGVEPCDDGNDIETDACLSGCVAASCGDGLVHEGVEPCDDGNDVDTDLCTQVCELAACGDGFVQPDAGEACDDGNLDDADGCESTCVPTPGALELAAGSYHTCALSIDHELRCWGSNGLGQLGRPGDNSDIGDNELPNTVAPVVLAGMPIGVGAGFVHSCAVIDGGDVQCWGYGLSGVLGYGNTNNIGDDEDPAAAGLVDVPGDVTFVDGGAEHTCVLLNGGAVRCWGSGLNGRLGLGNTTFIGDNETPAASPALNLGGPATQLAVGSRHTCALLDSAEVVCWGYNNFGQLGYGNTNTIGDNELPVSAGVVDVGAPVIAVAAGWDHTCVVTDANNVRCWGSGANGRLGYGDVNHIGDDETPASAGDVDLGGDLAMGLSVGRFHSCALLVDGNVRCWGAANNGQLGYGNTITIGDDELPGALPIVDIGAPVVRLIGYNEHSCVVLATNHVRCWGHNADGQLGYGNTSPIGDNETPASAGNVPFL